MQAIRIASFLSILFTINITLHGLQAPPHGNTFHQQAKNNQSATQRTSSFVAAAVIGGVLEKTFGTDKKTPEDQQNNDDSQGNNNINQITNYYPQGSFIRDDQKWHNLSLFSQICYSLSIFNKRDLLKIDPAVRKQFLKVVKIVGNRCISPTEDSSSDDFTQEDLDHDNVIFVPKNFPMQSKESLKHKVAYNLDSAPDLINKIMRNTEQLAQQEKGKQEQLKKLIDTAQINQSESKNANAPGAKEQSFDEQDESNTVPESPTQQSEAEDAESEEVKESSSTEQDKSKNADTSVQGEEDGDDTDSEFEQSESEDSDPITIDQLTAVQNTFDTFQGSLTKHPQPEKIDRYLNRLQAFKKIQENRSQMFEMEYDLNEHAEEILTRNGTDIDEVKLCYGNLLQHTIHKEYVDWLNIIADTRISSDYDELMSGLYDIHEGGIDLNKFGQSAQSMVISDFLWGSARIIREGLYGLGDSALGLANIALHPIQTGSDLLYTSFMAGYLYGSILEECRAIVVMSFYDPEKALARRNKDLQKLYDFVQNGVRAIADLSYEEKARHCTRMIADVFLAPKIITGCGKLSTLASKHCGATLSEIAKFENFLDLVPATAIIEESQAVKKAKNVLNVAAEIDPAYILPNRFNALANAHKYGSTVAKNLETMTPEMQKYLKNIQDIPELRNLAHFYTKEALIEALECYQFDLEAKNVKLPKNLERVTRDIFRLNSNFNFMQYKYDSNGKITLDSIEKAARTLGKYEAREAKKVLEFIGEYTDKDIFKCIVPFKGFYPQSLIPEAFAFDANGMKVWINESGTKHLHELISSPTRLEDYTGSLSSLGEQTLIGHEVILESLCKTLKKIDWTTIKWDTEFTINDWVIAVLEPKNPDQFPIVRHLRRTGRF